ncbi:MAG: DUF4174 domain-containing protein [Pseudomonadota bacterium]
MIASLAPRALALAAVIAGGFLAGSVQAQSVQDDMQDMPDIVFPGEAVDLADLKWERRPLVVFGDSPNDPRFLEQMDFLTERLDDLAERDVVVLTDTDPDSGSALRTKLRPRGFMIALIGKDGVVFLRKPLPWDVREITRVIDKMPLRQREMQERRGAS